MTKLAIFTDFDGTITTSDCNLALLAAYVDADRRATFDAMIFGHTHPLWEVMNSSLLACGVSLEEALRHLHGCVELDPTFAGFHGWCRARAIPLEVVSAGLYEVVHSFLDAAGLEVPIQANRAAFGEGCFGLTPLDPGCPTGVDKGGIVRQARAAGYTTVFIGDGFSDRLAVREADLVYAKASLARYCAKHGVPHVPFAHFDDVRRDLEARLAALPAGDQA
jgi:2-hydroxy-3-keto-5-methylthiopentenyl-1-phosphate phosphatase